MNAAMKPNGVFKKENTLETKTLEENTQKPEPFFKFNLFENDDHCISWFYSDQYLDLYFQVSKIPIGGLCLYIDCYAN